jgi:DNA sulfur modification protein DndE
MTKKKENHSFLSEGDKVSMKGLSNGFASYLYGYPLVMMGITENLTQSTLQTPSSGGAPINQLGKQKEFPSTEFSAVVLPSTSTLYVSAFMNLRKEPLILHLPDFGDRFFQMPILDGWSNVNPDSPSTRLGSPEGDYVIVGPNDNRDYSGDGRIVIKMDTDTAWMVGRVFTSATDKDLAYINENLYPNLTLTPWSKRNDANYQPDPNLPFNPYVEKFGSPVVSLENMNAGMFFTKLAAMMNYNAPVLSRDKKMIKKLVQIGFTFNENGVSFEYGKLSAADALKFKNFPKKAKQQIQKNKAKLEEEVKQAKAYLGLPPIDNEVVRTGWIFPREVELADFKDNYKYRAKIARWAFGANPVQDVLYGYGRVKSNDGKNKHTITFDTLPPTSPKAFWSVTIYNSDGTLVYNTNAIDEGVEYNAIGIPYVQAHKPYLHNDGKSITLYLQSEAPEEGTPEFQNWLPTPNQPDSLGSKDYIVFLRIYIPELVTVKGKPIVRRGNYVPKHNWFPGSITKVN